MKPLTRKEQFFNYILGKSASKPKPMTREEKILDEFEPVMTVNAIGNDDNTVTMDKTYSELREHIDNGGAVNYLFRIGTSKTAYKLYLAEFTDTVLQFIGFKNSVADDGTGPQVNYLRPYIVRISEYYVTWAQCDITLTA